ncbi:hypothetical protein H312_00078 [Anncaliia algerae PRA339]|uniref:Uncharacterized protein n=1 Tax=Anncaliia algerae PRA339 TaxID=1288291 RepID=A0A059F5E5_9MICR|nr:hypothetical protein H312_00078 [Anncaliia algerae PRA339]
MVIFFRVISTIINVRSVFNCMNNTFFIDVFFNIVPSASLFLFIFIIIKKFDYTCITPRTICLLAIIPRLYFLLPKKHSSICTILPEPSILMGLLEVKSCTNFCNYKEYLETVLIDNPKNSEIVSWLRPLIK